MFNVSLKVFGKTFPLEVPQEHNDSWEYANES